jgi:hypothetical protein
LLRGVTFEFEEMKFPVFVHATVTTICDPFFFVLVFYHGKVIDSTGRMAHPKLGIDVIGQESECRLSDLVMEFFGFCAATGNTSSHKEQQGDSVSERIHIWKDTEMSGQVAFAVRPTVLYLWSPFSHNSTAQGLIFVENFGKIEN